MQITAQLKFFRGSPRKAKLIIDTVRGRRVTEALNRLGVMTQGLAPIVSKLILSGVANAKDRYQTKMEDLWIVSIQTGQGPALKRWQPKAMGRATPIRKPTCHIWLTLSDVAPVSKKNKSTS